MPESNAPNQSQQNSPLSALDFNRIIGGPLSACVNAQEEAALATLDYLNGVVFRKQDGDPYDLEPVTVTFYFESGGVVNRLIMPLVCIVPVPYLQIEQVNLTFQATVTESSIQDNKVELKAKYSAPGDSGAITDVTKEEYKSKRCIDVNLCVTTADMPMGISKLIEIFNNQLVEIKQEEPIVDPKPPVLPPSDPEKTDEKLDVQPRYNIQLITKPHKEQKPFVVNTVNSRCHNNSALTGTSLNNILKSKMKTIPLETDFATARSIVKALKKKNIDAVMVEVL